MGEGELTPEQREANWRAFEARVTFNKRIEAARRPLTMVVWRRLRQVLQRMERSDADRPAP